MYEVRELFEEGYHVYELRNTIKKSWVKVAPERGGIIYSYGVNEEELLFLDKETFYNSNEKVRGGIPILFPVSGQLDNGIYEWQRKKYKMNLHGFARDMVWKVLDINNENKAAITIQLVSNDQTLKTYPFHFELIFTYELVEENLRIHQEYKNKDNHPMPICAGFHPYFKTNQKDMAYETDATRYYDYNVNEVKEFKGNINLMGKPNSVILLDVKTPGISFFLPNSKKRININYGKVFKYIVLWTIIDKEFICVEPWMAKPQALNQQKDLVIIEGNGSMSTEINFEVK